MGFSYKTQGIIAHTEEKGKGKGLEGEMGRTKSLPCARGGGTSPQTGDGRVVICHSLTTSQAKTEHTGYNPPVSKLTAPFAQGGLGQRPFQFLSFVPRPVRRRRVQASPYGGGGKKALRNLFDGEGSSPVPSAGNPQTFSTALENHVKKTAPRRWKTRGARSKCLIWRAASSCPPPVPPQSGGTWGKLVQCRRRSGTSTDPRQGARWD